MSSISLFILYVLSIYGYTCYGCRVDIEAEHGVSTNGVQMYRSKASNGITVLVKQGENITFEFKVTPSTCQLTIDNIQYSNDGISDTLLLYLNTTIIGQFTSTAVMRYEPGTIFRRSSQVGNPVQVFQGTNKLQILAKITDEYGVELDKISLQFNCSNTTIALSASDVCPQSVVNARSIDTTGKEKTLTNIDIITIASTVVLFVLGVIGIVVSIVSVGYKCYKKRRQIL